MRPSYCILAAMLCLFLFSLNHLGIQTSDDAAMLATAATVWDNHTLAIPEMEWLNERVNIGKNGRDGLLYSKYGLGQVLVAAGFYGIGETLFPQSDPFMWAGYPIAHSSAGASLALFTNVILGSLLVGLVAWETAGTFGNDAAIITTLLLALASPLWLAARAFGAEVGAALGIMIATMLAKRALTKESPAPLWYSVIGLGIAILFRPSSLAFGLAWIIWLWKRPLRDWIQTGIALVLVSLTIPAFNWMRYENIFESGYGHYGSGFALQFAGLVGFIFAPGRSVLLFAPWVLFLYSPLMKLVRREWNWETGVATGILGFYILHSLWKEWNGGWSFGPRLLIPVLPVTALIVATFLSKSSRLTILFFLVGSLLQVAALAIDPTKTHLDAIVHEGASFEEMVALSDQTLWSLQNNIVILQLRAVATPEFFVWLFLWAAMCLTWIGYILTRETVPRRAAEHIPAVDR